jgi:hypothetical protein
LAAEKFVGLKKELSISMIKGPSFSVDLRMASHSASDAMADHYRQGLMFEACQQGRHAALRDSVNTKLVDHVLS